MQKKPNFQNLHRIYFNSIEAFEKFSNPTNCLHLKNQVSVKVSNVFLYTDNYFDNINELLQSFSLKFVRIAQLDIALDGEDIIKLIDVLNKCCKSHTIQSSNDTISILPTAFKKNERHRLSWSIGKSKSKISTRVYIKSDVMELQKKDYIRSY